MLYGKKDTFSQLRVCSALVINDRYYSLEVNEDIFGGAPLSTKAASSKSHLVVDVVEADGGAAWACRLKTHLAHTCSAHTCLYRSIRVTCLSEPPFNPGPVVTWLRDIILILKNRHLKQKQRFNKLHPRWDPSSSSPEELFQHSPAKSEKNCESSCCRTFTAEDCRGWCVCVCVWAVCSVHVYSVWVSFYESSVIREVGRRAWEGLSLWGWEWELKYLRFSFRKQNWSSVLEISAVEECVFFYTEEFLLINKELKLLPVGDVSFFLWFNHIFSYLVC